MICVSWALLAALGLNTVVMCWLAVDMRRETSRLRRERESCEAKRRLRH